MEVKCNFANVRWDLDAGTFYACEINEASITKPGTEITKIVGQHLEGKSNKDVEAVCFNGTVVEYFPRGLRKIFPNLIALAITNCGLKTISREDLVGLENLEKLWLGRNKLRSLPSNLFTGMSQLKRISFRKNKLEFLTSSLLRPIIRNELKLLNFKENTKISAIYERGSKTHATTLQQLMSIIDEKCEKPIDEAFGDEFQQRFNELWTSGRYADFIVIGGGGDKGESKEFAVHKCVLGQQSSVIAAVFEQDMKEKKMETMTIEDFSADAVEGMLQFMYTGQVKQENNAMDLFAIAAKYNVKKLKEISEVMILHSINESNALEVFGQGNQHNSTALKRAGFEIIKKMFPEKILRNELMNEPENLTNIVEARRERKRKMEEVEASYEAKVNKMI